jgi:hypothetical protein
MAGYSMRFLAHDGHDAMQADTLVMPGHRGHGLCVRLQPATLEILQREDPA